MRWCCWCAVLLLLWCCLSADVADALMMLMSWCCWCTDAADVLILLMRWCCWCADVVLMISVFIVITVTKVIVAFMFKLLSRTGVCSKSGRAALRIVIGRYGYKSSFGAKNDRLKWVTPGIFAWSHPTIYVVYIIKNQPHHHYHHPPSTICDYLGKL